MRAAWIGLGLAFTAVGFAGLALPLLPGTPFFLLAAWAFARSSPRLLQWLLDLPHVGRAIRDYRSGLGIPRRAKLLAAVVASGAVAASALATSSAALRIGVISAGVVGVGYVVFRVPTREVVLAARESSPEG